MDADGEGAPSRHAPLATLACLVLLSGALLYQPSARPRPKAVDAANARSAVVAMPAAPPAAADVGAPRVVMAVGAEHRVVSDGEDGSGGADVEHRPLDAAVEGLPPSEAERRLTDAQAHILLRRRKEAAARQQRASFLDSAGDCRADPPPTFPGRRYLTAEPMKDGYGLTNQLLAYAGLVAWARYDTNGPGNRRRILMPAARTYFLNLVDVNRSVAPYWPDDETPLAEYRRPQSVEFAHTLVDVVVSRPCELAYIKRLRMRRMKDTVSSAVRRRLDRRFAVVAAESSLLDHRRVMSAALNRRAPVIGLWDMYAKWPYAADATRYDFPAFLCGLAFAPRVERAAAAVVAGIAAKVADGADTGGLRRPPPSSSSSSPRPSSSAAARYVAVHLRMEPQDMATMGRSVSDPPHVAAFFGASIFPLARRVSASAVYVASGALNATMWRAIVSAGARQRPPIAVLRKDDLLPAATTTRLYDEGDAAARQQVYRGKYVVTPTTALAAAVDLLVLGQAAATAVTAFSSLSAAVYSLRCCDADGNPTPPGLRRAPPSPSQSSEGPDGVHLYDVYRDGSLTALHHFRCGQRLGEYVVSPSRGLDEASRLAFNANFNANSSLFDADDAKQRNAVAWRAGMAEFQLIADEAEARHRG